MARLRYCLGCATKDEARVVQLKVAAFRKPCSGCGEPTLFELDYRNTSPRREKKRIEDDVEPHPIEESED